MKIHNKTHITLTPDDIEKAIERYVNDELVEVPKGCTIKFIIEDAYQKDSLTGYSKPEFVGAEVTVLE
jgi:hypothetical protein